MRYRCDLGKVGSRIRAARESLGMTQEALATAISVSVRGIQSNERQISVPGGEVICGLIQLGINANWLLTGEGPMRLSDLVAPVPQAAPSPPPQDLNQTYLSIAIQGVLEARPELAPAQQARLAADIYLRFQSMNMAKPEAA